MGTLGLSGGVAGRGGASSNDPCASLRSDPDPWALAHPITLGFRPSPRTHPASLATPDTSTRHSLLRSSSGRIGSSSGVSRDALGIPSYREPNVFAWDPSLRCLDIGLPALPLPSRCLWGESTSPYSYPPSESRTTNVSFYNGNTGHTTMSCFFPFALPFVMPSVISNLPPTALPIAIRGALLFPTSVHGFPRDSRAWATPPCPTPMDLRRHPSTETPECSARTLLFPDTQYQLGSARSWRSPGASQCMWQCHPALPCTTCLWKISRACQGIISHKAR